MLFVGFTLRPYQLLSPAYLFPVFLQSAVLSAPAHLFLLDYKSSANTAIHDSAYLSDLPYTSDTLHYLCSAFVFILISRHHFFLLRSLSTYNDSLLINCSKVFSDQLSPRIPANL